MEIKEIITRRGQSEPHTYGRTQSEKLHTEKYLGDQIREKGTAASITKIIDKRTRGLDKKV